MRLTNDPVTTPDEAKDLICELGRRFYALGWVSGTGGGISLRVRVPLPVPERTGWS